MGCSRRSTPRAPPWAWRRSRRSATRTWRRRDRFHLFVPKLVVQLDGDGEIWGIEVSPPFPFGRANHRRQVATLGAAERKVAKREQRVARRKNGFRLAPDVDISLRAQQRIGRVFGRMRKPLQQGEFNPAAFERVRDFEE